MLVMTIGIKDRSNDLPYLTSIWRTLSSQRVCNDQSKFGFTGRIAHFFSWGFFYLTKGESFFRFFNIYFGFVVITTAMSIVGYLKKLRKSLFSRDTSPPPLLTLPFFSPCVHPQPRMALTRTRAKAALLREKVAQFTQKRAVLCVKKFLCEFRTNFTCRYAADFLGSNGPPPPEDIDNMRKWTILDPGDVYDKVKEKVSESEVVKVTSNFYTRIVLLTNRKKGLGIEFTQGINVSIYLMAYLLYADHVKVFAQEIDGVKPNIDEELKLIQTQLLNAAKTLVLKMHETAKLLARRIGKESLLSSDEMNTIRSSMRNYLTWYITLTTKLTTQLNGAKRD